MPVVNSFPRMFFDIISEEKIFIWASLYTFIGNYSILDYFNSLFILDLNSEFRNLNYGIRNCYSKDLFYKFLWIISEGLCDINLKGTLY